VAKQGKGPAQDCAARPLTNAWHPVCVVQESGANNAAIMQAAMTWEAQNFTQSATAALEEESADPDTLQLIAAARGLNLP